MKKLLAIILSTVMVFAFTACGGGEGETKDSSVMELDDCTAKYIGSDLIKDADGNDSILIHLDFTNNSDETKSFYWTFFYTLKQGDTDLEMAVTFLNEDTFETYTDTAFKEVAPGESTKVTINYNIIDRTTPIEVRFTDLFDDEVGKFTIDPSALREKTAGEGTSEGETAGTLSGYYVVETLIMDGEELGREMLELMDMADNTFAVFYDDGTADIAIEGESMEFTYEDGKVFNNFTNGTYALEGDILTLDMSDIGYIMTFKRSDGTPPETNTYTGGFDDAAIEAFTGDWHGLAEIYGSEGDYADANGQIFEVVARFTFDEYGDVVPYMLFYVNGGVEIEDLSLYNVEDYYAMEIYGSFLGVELYESELFLDDYGALYILLFADDGEGNTINIQACLRTLDDTWDPYNDDPCADDGFVKFYSGKSLEEILEIYGLDPSVLPPLSGGSGSSEPVATGEGIVDLETLKAGFAFYLTESHPNNNYRRPSYEEIVEHFGGVEGKKDRDDLWSDTLHIYRWDTPDGENWVIINFSVDAEGEHAYSVSWSTGLNETQKTYGW